MSDSAIKRIILKFIEKKGGVNKGCKYVAKKLNNVWTWKYIYNVYMGAKPSRKLKARLCALEVPKPPRKRYRKIIEATSKEQWERWNTLTADELQSGLDDKVKGVSDG